MKIGTMLRRASSAACFLAIAFGICASAAWGAASEGPGAPGKDSSAAEVRALASDPTSGDTKPADFLGAIGVPQAWKLLDGYGDDVTGTIAVVDTGVDLKHPELIPYLTDGVNLLDARKPPQDDNGHGTAVAGILAEIAEAAKQTEGGASWKMKIMPVKALDRNGEGDEANLAAGIRYAVGHGANIVVLSLGLRRDTPEMRDVVALAESKGVLLVAATGNDGAEFGTKAAVQYPAAYPTVLAVAGLDGGGAQSRSTSGPEVDVAAPWKVETLKLGGGKTTMEGSSMSAPQAAGAAAMLRARHPGWTPAMLRETLRRTAEAAALKGWDRYTGYGQVRADAAVKAAAVADWREPDENRLSAGVFPLGTELLASWSSSADVDGYIVDVPYEGDLTVSWKILGSASAAGPSKPSLRLFPMSGSKEMAPSAHSPASAVSWRVPKGKYYLRTTRGSGGDAGRSEDYLLQSSFAMAPDGMEPNQTALTAYTLQPRSQKWTGTFDSQGDEDWAVIDLPRPGKLRIRVDTDTTRIDPAILLERAGETAEETDDNADGKSEEIVIPEAKAGKYYIRIRNAVSDSPAPVIGTYTAQLEYITPYEDLQEPNDGPLTATPLTLAPEDSRSGLIDREGDADWFRFRTEDTKQISVRLSGLPAAVRGTVELYDKNLKLLRTWSGAGKGAPVEGELGTGPGTYYLKVTADAPFRSSYYKLSVRQEAANAGFADTSGHWAEEPIRAVSEAGWMAGYAGGVFRPDRDLTRAEAIVIAVRAFKPASSGSNHLRFSDITRNYWAYNSILEADAAKWLTGFAGPRLEPNRPMTRGEAAMLFAKAARLSIPAVPARTFADVPLNHPAAGALQALERKGWVHGFPDGSYRPALPISRAEWAAMLAEML